MIISEQRIVKFCRLINAINTVDKAVLGTMLPNFHETYLARTIRDMMSALHAALEEE